MRGPKPRIVVLTHATVNTAENDSPLVISAKAACMSPRRSNAVISTEAVQHLRAAKRREPRISPLHMREALQH